MCSVGQRQLWGYIFWMKKKLVSFIVICLETIWLCLYYYSLHDQSLYKAYNYIDIDKIDAAAWPSLIADLGARNQSIYSHATWYALL